MKVRVPKNAFLARFFLGRVGRSLVAIAALLTIGTLGTFTYFYARYSKLIDEKLRSDPIAVTARIFAAPQSVAVGDVMTPADVAAQLRRSGYTESRGNAVGYFQVHPNSIEIFPGPDSYFDQEAGVIRFSHGRISEVISLSDNTPRTLYQLEPPLITNVAGANREKRRLVKFHDIPKVLVDAVTSAEDKRFFQHAGIDPIRIVKAAYIDLREGRKEQGASTLSQQLARMFWLDQGKRWRRKLAEMIITLQLEQKLSKEEIFEYYANDIFLGARGSFQIHGFGEAAQAYLGKDLSQITLPEAAQLAGLIQRPAIFDPYRHPDRARERRNLVLSMMRQNGEITDRDYALAVNAPLTVARGAVQAEEAPYFVDLVNETVQAKISQPDVEANSLRIYTTLDLRLQRAAEEAVRAGMDSVDQLIRRQRRFRGKTPPDPQVALVAMDPHTGEVKALAGGRNYGMSQLNHVLAKRQPGSIFKPFVYAAALDTAIEGGQRIITTSSMVSDQPTTFWFDGKSYEPSNFEHKFYGDVSLRDALAHSLNVATVKVAEMVGFDKVVAMANRAGMNYSIQPTPAVALGAYEITPLEAAGAYTVFSNQGQYVQPTLLSLVRSREGKTLFRSKVESQPALDPRVAYLITSMMESVLQNGTAVGVRQRYGFMVPAAGKTGTSHDGWFAGFTSQLLCVVWVGFDDNTELDLEGAHSAAPIWAQFMKQALDYREYRDTQPFQAPDGIVTISIDPQSGMPATPACPTSRPEVYIAGTQPVGACPLHGGRQVTNVAGWDLGPAAPAKAEGAGENAAAPPQPDPNSRRPASVRQTQAEVAQPAAPAAPPQPKPEKKGIFRRLLGVFK